MATPNLKKKLGNTLKAAILRKINGPLTFEEVELTELGIGQVLVRVLTSGLCGAQLMEIEGLKGNSKFVPHLMGHEGCGIVEGFREGVTKVKIGQKVVMHWMKGTGVESSFPQYKLDGKTISSGKVVTLSEFSIVSENRLTVVPDETPNDLCSLLGCGMTTALGAINNDAHVKIGESAVVLGCGGVGLNLIQGLSMVGAFPVIGVDIKEEKEILAKNAGADFFINLKSENLVASLSRFKGADVIFDTTGHAELLSSAVEALSDKGRLILIGQPKQNITINALSLFGGSGKTIKATQGGQTNPSEDIPRYARMAIAAKISADKIVSHHFSMKDIDRAVNILKHGNCGRIILNND